MKQYKVYTDGACSGNPGPGGWGVAIVYDDNIDKFNGFDPETTNNRMELLAAIKGIQEIPSDSVILLYTDSKYVKEGITNWIKNWKKNKWITSSKSPVKNKDLWMLLDDLNNSRNISWCWIKAHQNNDSDDNIYNNLADELARSAIK
tara:strand:+ start:598 stop:1038 length:441 start_codon:yes stop_codon:yes gene_type:complete